MTTGRQAWGSRGSRGSRAAHRAPTGLSGHAPGEASARTSGDGRTGASGGGPGGQVRRLAAGVGLLGLLAVAAEGALRLIAPERRPLSAPVHARVEIEASIERTWAILSDIPSQLRWMPEMKRVGVLTPGPVGEGSVGEATVRIFGISVTDRVIVTAFEPPTTFAIEHEGLFTGGGTLRLRPGLDDTTTIVEWEEQLMPPLLPALGWLLMRPMIAVLYQRDLYLLRDLVESAEAAPAGGPGED